MSDRVSTERVLTQFLDPATSAEPAAILGFIDSQFRPYGRCFTCFPWQAMHVLARLFETTWSISNPGNTDDVDFERIADTWLRVHCVDYVPSEANEHANAIAEVTFPIREANQ